MCAGEAEGVRISHGGQGTRETTAWLTEKVLLRDCVGSTDADLSHSAAADADLLVVFLGDGCRGEAMHGDVMLWAWRLRKTVRTIFVLPKFDAWRASRWGWPPCWPFRGCRMHAKHVAQLHTCS